MYIYIYIHMYNCVYIYIYYNITISNMHYPNNFILSSFVLRPAPGRFFVSERVAIAITT